jgi:hypothetical protein
LVDLGVSIGAALALAAWFHESQFLRYFIESLLRVADLPGTTVLMLALALALGSIAEFWVGARWFAREFNLNATGLWRLFWQSFAASVIGGACAYLVLTALGAYLSIDTAPVVFAQGFVGGIVGLAVTAAMLMALGNPEIREVWGAFARRFRDAQPVTVEPSDISS